MTADDERLLLHIQSMQWGFSQSTRLPSSPQNAVHPDQMQNQRHLLLLQEGEEFIRVEEYEAAEDSLHLLMEKINVLKQNKRDYDSKIQLVCVYNLAAVHQKQWNLDQCLPLLEKFVVLARSQQAEHLKSSTPVGGVACEPNRHWFKMKSMLVKGLLQYCAVLSQVGEHKKALKVASQATVELRGLFKRGIDDCKKQIARRQTNEQKKSVKGLKMGHDRIEFSNSVLSNAVQTLIKLGDMMTYNQVIEDSFHRVQAEMKEAKSKIIYWQSMPENNVKMLRQSFQDPQSPTTQEKKKHQRSLLGLKRNQNWLEQFTIAKIMFMSPVSHQEFVEADNLIFEFNQRNLIEKAILLSVAYFSLSIQLRFLEENRKHDPQMLPHSQIFHLKAIQVVCRHIKQNSAFVTHLVVNYHKHYKNSLNIIEEESSMAECSSLIDRKFCSGEEEQRDSSTLQVPGQIVCHRRDSIYFCDNVEQAPKQQLTAMPKPVSKAQKTIFGFKKANKKKQEQDERLETSASRRLGNSNSLSKQSINLKDRTMKKSGGFTKVITLGNSADLRMLDRSQKSISSSSRQKSLKKSLSQSKTLKNSTTLKKNKSPQKNRGSKIQVKEESSKRDFSKKNAPQTSRALDLLKKSESLHEPGFRRSIYTSPATFDPKKKR